MSVPEWDIPWDRPANAGDDTDTMRRLHAALWDVMREQGVGWTVMFIRNFATYVEKEVIKDHLDAKG